MSVRSLKGSRGLSVREICVFAVLGALMFASKIAMDLLPNIHLLGMFIVLYTAVYRIKALIPIYIFVVITGLYGGFATWWLPYLYIWAVLWGMAMLIPPTCNRVLRMILYPAVCSLHGFLYGVLYAPAQALIFGLDFQQMLAWIAAGLPFDVTHGISNLFTGMLVLPLSDVMMRVEARHRPRK